MHIMSEKVQFSSVCVVLAAALRFVAHPFDI